MLVSVRCLLFFFSSAVVSCLLFISFLTFGTFFVTFFLFSLIGGISISNFFTKSTTHPPPQNPQIINNTATTTTNTPQTTTQTNTKHKHKYKFNNCKIFNANVIFETSSEPTDWNVGEWKNERIKKKASPLLTGLKIMKRNQNENWPWMTWNWFWSWLIWFGIHPNS